MIDRKLFLILIAAILIGLFKGWNYITSRIELGRTFTTNQKVIIYLIYGISVPLIFAVIGISYYLIIKKINKF